MRWLALFVAWVTFTVSIVDINVHAYRTTDPNDFNAVADLQVVLEESIGRIDAAPTRACFADWLTLERAALRLYALGLRAHVEGDDVLAAADLAAMKTVRYHSGRALQATAC